MGKNKKKKNVEVVKVTTNRFKRSVFVYGALMTHQIQESVWGELKNGLCIIMNDHELKMFDNGGLYAVPKFGEQVSGKLYELSDEQVTSTDECMGSDFERVTITQGTKPFQAYILAGGK